MLGAHSADMSSIDSDQISSHVRRDGGYDASARNWWVAY